MKPAGPRRRLHLDDRLVFALPALFDQVGQHLDRHSVIDPGIAERIAHFFANDAEQLALARGHGAAACPRIIGDGVDHIDIAYVGSLKDAAPAVQLGVRGDHAVLHRHGFVTRGDLEKVAEG